MKVNVLRAGTYFNLLAWKDKGDTIFGLCEGMTTLMVYEDKETAVRCFNAMERHVARLVALKS